MIKIFCDGCGNEINPETEGFNQFEGYIFCDNYLCKNNFKNVKSETTPSILQVDFTDTVKTEMDSHKIKNTWWIGIIPKIKIEWR